jgi:hypothetical protein
MVLDEHDFKAEQEQERKEKQVELITNLINLDDPETVSFIIAAENDDLSLLLSLAKDLEEWKLVNLPNVLTENFLLKYIKQNLITRFSIKGKRSEQLIQVLNGLPQETPSGSNDLIDVLKQKFQRK